jgi:predicted NBD/HSP70 family sugar kinase
MFPRTMAQIPRKPQIRVREGWRHVLDELHAGGPRNRVEIRRSLEQAGLDYSLDTIADRIHELREAGLVREDTAEQVGIRAKDDTPRLGRPPQYTTLTDAWGLGLGLEIGKSKIRAAVVTPAGAMLARSSCERFGQNLSYAFRDASTQVETVLAKLGCEQRERLRKGVVAVPAPVDRANREGTSKAFPANGMGSLDKLLTEELGIPDIPLVAVNDAVARAIGEGRFGLARASHSAFVMKVSSGVGGSLLRRGRIVSGFRGVAGEVGHLRVSLSGRDVPRGLSLPPLSTRARCSCDDTEGQHLEAYASTLAIARRLGGGGAGVHDFNEMAKTWQKKGQHRSRRCIEDVAHLIGQVAVNVVAMCDPQVIVLTGRFAACGDAALQPIRGALAAMKPMQRSVPEVLVDGPRPDETHDEWEWVGVQGAGRLAIELGASVEVRLKADGFSIV